MNRPFEFRVWDKQASSFVKSGIVLYDYLTIKDVYALVAHLSQGEGLPPFFSDKDVAESNKRFVIQQFTGMLDKNGNKIFEGDIVQWGHFKRIRRGQMVYLARNMSFVCKEQYPYNASAGCMQVLGNVCENPELLK